MTKLINGKPAKQHPLYRTWVSMRFRCQNANAIGYEYYGGRGIKVCERWMMFENFVNDMGEKPKNTSLDRIDNHDDYTPANCRWATSIEQNNNRRKSSKSLGVSRFENKFRAYWYENKKQKHLGLFNTFEEALLVKEQYVYEMTPFVYNDPFEITRNVEKKRAHHI